MLMAKNLSLDAGGMPSNAPGYLEVQCCLQMGKLETRNRIPLSPFHISVLAQTKKDAFWVRFGSGPPGTPHLTSPHSLHSWLPLQKQPKGRAEWKGC